MTQPTIHYPTREPEAEVQAALFAILRILDYDACLEVPEIVPNGKRKTRLDIVIFDPAFRQPMVIVETKRAKRDPKCSKAALVAKEKLREINQIRKYRQHGLPVYTCHGTREIPAILLQLQIDFSSHRSEADSCPARSQTETPPSRNSSRPSSGEVPSRKGFLTF